MGPRAVSRSTSTIIGPFVLLVQRPGVSEPRRQPGTMTDVTETSARHPGSRREGSVSRLESERNRHVNADESTGDDLSPLAEAESERDSTFARATASSADIDLPNCHS